MNGPSPARVYGRSMLGLTAHPVTVECHIGSSLPGTTIVGLPQSAVREARDRVKSALENSGFEVSNLDLVINLAPGDLHKAGTGLDLPIALSILIATHNMSLSGLEDTEFIGELSLFGHLRKVPGILSSVLACQRAGRRLVIPTANSAEGGLVPESNVTTARDLREVVESLTGSHTLPAPPAPAAKVKTLTDRNPILGQEAAKRALTIAAAGGHHLLMVGPPGTGKTLLARRICDLLPPLEGDRLIEVAAIYSAIGQDRDDYTLPPFRDPHHSASPVALIGGGSTPVPGEASLAHHGVLFLDELPHFKPAALNLLREPIETGKAVIARANYKVNFPCRFQLIAAMNPCPAGRRCTETACRCTPGDVKRYQSRISGPLLDRIDLHVSVPELPPGMLTNPGSGRDTFPGSREIVIECRQRQLHRQRDLNAALAGKHLEKEQRQADVDEGFLKKAIDRYRLSARSFHKTWRIARTIADLEQSRIIRMEHVMEALSYRALDWENGV